jgi:hypothetical protein
MNYELMTADDRRNLTEFKAAYTTLLSEFVKAKQAGHLPVGYGDLVVKVNELERQLPPEIAFSARKHIDLAWDPSIAEAYGLERRRA